MGDGWPGRRRLASGDGSIPRTDSASPDLEKPGVTELGVVWLVPSRGRGCSRHPTPTSTDRTPSNVTAGREYVLFPAVTKGCLMEVRGAHYPPTWGLNTTPL